jgi:hypothetical protein
MMSNRNVGTEIAALPRMEIKDLRSRYAEIFGEPTKSGNKNWLAKRIAWRLQSMAEGDLSERARKRAAELARDSDLRTTTPRVRTKLSRFADSIQPPIYRGRPIETSQRPCPFWWRALAAPLRSRT